MNKFYKYFLVVIGAGLFLYFVAVMGWYPVAMVDYRLIMATSLQKQSAVALNFYNKNLGTRTLGGEIAAELRRATLDKLIESILIDKALQQKVGETADQLLIDKLINIKQDLQSASEAIEAIYGLDTDDFENLVLIPQARREILMDALAKERTSFEIWLADAKSKAGVIILAPGLHWNGQGVERYN